MATVPVLLLLISAFSSPVLSRLTTFHKIQHRGVNYTEARAACRANHTDLATVYTDEDNQKLKNMTASVSHVAWLIGLYRSQPSEKWSNGDDVTFSNLTGDCGVSDCCAAMKPDDGSWESLPCRQTRNFLCYKGGVLQHKINYHLITEKVSWYEAQHYCRKNYTDLASIGDQRQNKDVQTEGLKSGTSFWIGLLRDDWEWSDGGNSAFRDWRENEPQSSPYSCATLFEGKWLSVLCMNSYFALCYQTSIHVSDVGMSWESALEYCNDGNRARILHIDSTAEQEELEYELRRRRVPPGSLWVGQTPRSDRHLSGVRQTGPPLSHCPGDTHTAEVAPEYQLNIAELQVVCEVKSP